jgi:hypothetical protein
MAEPRKFQIEGWGAAQRQIQEAIEFLCVGQPASARAEITDDLVALVTLAAGVFLMIAPRIVSFAVAVYLITVGLLGLNGIYHIFN